MDNKKRIRYFIITDLLKDILINAQYNAKQGTILKLHELKGILTYMYITGEITWDTKKRIEHLTSLILQKYNIR